MQHKGVVPLLKNVVCGLVTPERTWILGHSSSTRRDVAAAKPSRYGQTCRRKTSQENRKNDKSLRIRDGLSRSYVDDQS